MWGVSEQGRGGDALVMAMLTERLRPIAHVESERQPREGEGDPLWMRYADLLKLGFSPETSMIVAEAPIALGTVTSLLVPDLR
jgi:hypothetical protein